MINPWVVRVGSFLTFSVAVSQLGADAFDPPPSWSQTRRPGASINGYWHSGSSGGCFESENVYEYVGNRQLTHLDRMSVVTATDVRQEARDGIQHIEELVLVGGATGQHKYFSTVYRDEGTKLDLLQVTVDGHTTKVRDPVATEEGDLILCSKAHFLSRMKLFLYRPFRAGNQS